MLGALHIGNALYGKQCIAAAEAVAFAGKHDAWYIFHDSCKSSSRFVVILLHI